LNFYIVLSVIFLQGFAASLQLPPNEIAGVYWSPKKDAKIDLWPKEITPSTELRKWYAHDPEHWDVFQQCYRAELVEQAKMLQQIRAMAKQEQVTLITAAKSKDYNHVIVLKQVLEEG
jgi:uncharacterized protein YeaO (DUF488 family)